jgi:hypothetical protein
MKIRGLALIVTIIALTACGGSGGSGGSGSKNSSYAPETYSINSELLCVEYTANTQEEANQLLNAGYSNSNTCQQTNYIATCEVFGYQGFNSSALIYYSENSLNGSISRNDQIEQLREGCNFLSGSFSPNNSPNDNLGGNTLAAIPVDLTATEFQNYLVSTTDFSIIRISDLEKFHVDTRASEVERLTNKEFINSDQQAIEIFKVTTNNIPRLKSVNLSTGEVINYSNIELTNLHCTSIKEDLFLMWKKNTIDSHCYEKADLDAQSTQYYGFVAKQDAENLISTNYAFDIEHSDVLILKDKNQIYGIIPKSTHNNLDSNTYYENNNSIGIQINLSNNENIDMLNIDNAFLFSANIVLVQIGQNITSFNTYQLANSLAGDLLINQLDNISNAYNLNIEVLNNSNFMTFTNYENSTYKQYIYQLESQSWIQRASIESPNRQHWFSIGSHFISTNYNYTTNAEEIGFYDGVSWQKDNILSASINSSESFEKINIGSKLILSNSSGYQFIDNNGIDSRNSTHLNDHHLMYLRNYDIAPNSTAAGVFITSGTGAGGTWLHTVDWSSPSFITPSPIGKYSPSNIELGNINSLYFIQGIRIQDTGNFLISIQGIQLTGNLNSLDIKTL